MRSAGAWLLVLVLAGGAFAQERVNSVTAFGAFTTSAKLFPAPNDPDEFTRGQFFPLNNFFSFGLEFRREFRDLRVEVGLSAEYISTSDLFSAPDSLIAVPVRDGFQAVPLELTGYFLIPVGGERLQIFMGAGVGLYFGRRTYEYGNARSALTGTTAGAGIHVASGLDYRLTETLSLRSVIKFRDVQFDSQNRFTQATTLYNGTAVTLPADLLSSRINIDGMAVTLGLVVHF